MNGIEISISNFLLHLMNVNRRHNINIKDSDKFLFKFDSRQPYYYYVYNIGMREEAETFYIEYVTQALNRDSDERVTKTYDFLTFDQMLLFIEESLNYTSVGYF